MSCDFLYARVLLTWSGSIVLLMNLVMLLFLRASNVDRNNPSLVLECVVEEYFSKLVSSTF